MPEPGSPRTIDAAGPAELAVTVSASASSSAVLPTNTFISRTVERASSRLRWRASEPATRDSRIPDAGTRTTSAPCGRTFCGASASPAGPWPRGRSVPRHGELLLAPHHGEPAHLLPNRRPPQPTVENAACDASVPPRSFRIRLGGARCSAHTAHNARSPPRQILRVRDHSMPLLVFQTDNAPRVRDGCIRLSTRGHTRTSATHSEGQACRTNVPVNARSCTPVPPPNLYGKEGISGLSPAAPREALELHRQLGDAWGSAFSRLMVAYATGQKGDCPRAPELFGESTRQFCELGDRHYALRAARAHAWAHYEGGDLKRTHERSEEIIREAPAAHDPFPEGIALAFLVDIALDQGRVEDAVSPAESSYRIFRDLGNLLLIAFCFGRFARAIRHQLDEAAFAEVWNQGRALTADEAVALALNASSERAGQAFRRIATSSSAYAEKYVAPSTGESATIFVADDHVYRVRPRFVSAWSYARAAHGPTGRPAKSRPPVRGCSRGHRSDRSHRRRSRARRPRCLRSHRARGRCRCLHRRPFHRCAGHR